MKTTFTTLIALLLFIAHGVAYSVERTPVGAAGIVSAGYDDKNRAMIVEFKSGKLVQFSGMLFSTFDKFMEAEKKGAYFNEHIKGKYTGKVIGKVKSKTEKKDKKKKKKRKKKKKGKKKSKKKSDD